MVSLEHTTAIVVGIERYAAGITWDLNGPASDALRIITYLNESGILQKNITAYVTALPENGARIAEISALCAAVEPPTQQKLNDLIQDRLRTEQCELLFLYWSGHGFITTRKDRLLFTADAVPDERRNIDLNSVLERLGTDACPGIERVDAVIDTCANYVAAGTAGISRTTYWAGTGVPGRAEFVLCAASPGEYARNITAEKTGLFTRELMRRLRPDDAKPVFPPDWAAVRRALATRFDELRDQGLAEHTPSFSFDAPNEKYDSPPPADAGADTFFRRLGVFSGDTFSFLACAEINPEFRTRDVKRRLDALVGDGVLVLQDPARLRYAFAREGARAAADRLQLFGDADDIRERHAKFYEDFVELHERRLMSPVRRASLREIADEISNIKAALAWCLEKPAMVERALRIGAGLFWFWNLSALFSEGLDCMHALLDRCADAPRGAPQAKALYAAGGLAFLQGKFAEAETLLSESVDIWREQPSDTMRDRWLGYALVILGRVKTRFEPARNHEQEAIDLFTHVNDIWGHALSLNDLGYVLMSKRHLEEAREAYSASLSLWSRVGEPWGRPLTLNNLGHLMSDDGQLPQARRAHDEALRYHLAEGDKWGAAESLKYLAEVAVRSEDFDEAYACYRESLSLHRAVGRKQLVADCLLGLGEVVLRAAKLDKERAVSAARYLAMSQNESDRYKFARTDEEYQRCKDLETSLLRCLGKVRFAAVVEAVKELTPDDVIATIPERLS